MYRAASLRLGHLPADLAAGVGGGVDVHIDLAVHEVLDLVIGQLRLARDRALDVDLPRGQGPAALKHDGIRRNRLIAESCFRFKR